MQHTIVEELQLGPIPPGPDEWPGFVARLQAAFGRQAEELAQARREGQAANEAKTAFLAVMSHELRTPLNGIFGMTELLLATSLTAEQREYARTVRSSAESLLLIINDVLVMPKLEAGTLALEVLDFDLHQTIESVIESYAHLADEKGLELGYMIDPNVPVASVGDPTRVRQLLLNVVGNAIKFTERGEVAVRVGVAERDGNRFTLRCEVRDTGIGIEPAAAAHVFEPFTQADNSTTRPYGGAGLGLAICKRLLALMGGDIGFTSEPGVGTTFWFTIGLQVGQAPVERPVVPIQLSGRRALIVDDNATNRSILHHQLSAWGMPSVGCWNGAKALEQLQAAHQRGEPFDLVLVDMMMPEMNGLDMARAVSADPVLKGVPMIMLTSLGIYGPAEEALEAGVAACLTKPVRQSMLFDCIMGVLVKSQGGAATAAAGPTEPVPLGARVLVVDDNAVNLKVAVSTLRKLGYLADTASDGLDALSVLEQQRYDAILMDCQMPRMDGYQCTAEIRKRQAEGSRTPILALTANANPGERERCLAAGMDDYLTKPITGGVLGEALGRWIVRKVPEAVAPSNRILVAEDTALNRKIIAQMLQKLGYEVDLVEDGAQAVAKLDETAYAAILMDCHMPNMDGFQATAAIRARTDAAARVPVIALTANAGQGDREECLAAGMDDHLAKPIKVDDLSAALARWVKAAEAVAPGGAPAPAGDVLDFTLIDQLRELQEEGEPDVVTELVDLFLRDAPGALEAIDAAVASGDGPAINRTAHALKGSAANIGARVLAAACEVLERRGREGVLTGLAEALTTLHNDFDHAKAALVALRKP